MKKSYSFDLWQLETDVIDAYSSLKKKDNPDTRTDFFEKVKKLAYAILVVGTYSKQNIDFKLTAYEYAVYMFERIIVGTFKPIPKKGDRFPWQNYIRLNIRHIIMSRRDDIQWRDVINDLNFLIDDLEKSNPSLFIDKNQETVENFVIKDQYSKTLFKSLRLYYSITEIKRLLPICLDCIYENTRYYITKNQPPDVRDFSLILISVAKRLASVNNLTHSLDTVSVKMMKKALKSSVRSTIFLSTIANSNFFSKELLLSLDIDSLYRLCSICGGDTIKIPTLRELDTLLGATVIISKAIMEGKSYEKALVESKQDFGLIFAHNINLQSFVSKVVDTFDIFNEESHSEALINILGSSIKSIDILLDKMVTNSGAKASTDLLEKYKVLSDNFCNLTNSIMEISRTVKYECKEEE